MSVGANPPPHASTLAANKQRVLELRTRARALFDGGAPGVAVATYLAEHTDQIVVALFEEVLATLPPDVRQQIAATCSIVAVGGTGRGELAPFSDIDILFLAGRRAHADQFRAAVNRAIQAYWDAGLKLGHAVRTVPECIALAKSDPQIATSLVEARKLWGSDSLFQSLTRQFRRRVIEARPRQFIRDCIRARWPDGDDGPPAQELEPDVKSSLGGLRDLHLIRWIGYALFDSRDIDSIRGVGQITQDEAIALREAWEFLTQVRIDLHFAAGKAQDRLTRDEQLRITDRMGIQATSTQRAVEVFMQRYFKHTAVIIRIARRFSSLNRKSPLRKLRDLVFAHRADGHLRVGAKEIDASPRHFGAVTKDLETILRLYKSAALYNVKPSRRLEDAITRAVPQLPQTVSPAAASVFLDILKLTKPLPPILRSIYDTGVIEILIPDVGHTRSLMQFNQYHQFTVDEHTLQAVQRCTAFEDDRGSLGATYAALKPRELLHLAIILHDIGKGFGRPHAEVGYEIAQRVTKRLCLPDAAGEIVSRLVLRHLEMAHIAFRRDISDLETLVQFAHHVGTPEVLQMLYLLTAADVQAVGPSAWTEWKAELLGGLFDEAMLLLSGKHQGVHEQERLQNIARQVTEVLSVDVPAPPSQQEVERQLSVFPASYLVNTPPSKIAADLLVMNRLDPHEVSIQGRFNPETSTVEYRIITANQELTAGCFHKLAGALTARRLQILAADIATTTSGVVVDAFRVHDRDFIDGPPPERIQSIANSLRDVLFGRENVATLFRRNRRFGVEPPRKTFADLPLRVQLDTDSSETRTIIDVFAHDRPGLLYTISCVIFELGLSVELAKIATNFDQVVDVFYVVENDGRKVVDPERVKQIQDTLYHALEHFDRDGYRLFSS